MENFYEQLENLLSTHKKIQVYPVIYGLYEWKYLEPGHYLLLENLENTVFVRSIYTNDKIEKDLNILNKYGKFISPRNTNSSTVVKALKKMDTERIDGVCLIMCDDTLMFVESYTCFCARTQFVSWILEIMPLFESIEDFQDLVEASNSDNIQFATKYMYYILNHYKNDMDEKTWKHFLLVNLNHEKKNYLI